jgi:hypothetical protein
MLEKIEKMTLWLGIYDNKDIKEELSKIADSNNIPFHIVSLNGISSLWVDSKNYGFFSFNGERNIKTFIEALKKEEEKKSACVETTAGQGR